MRRPTDGPDRRLILRAGFALFTLLAVAGCGSSSPDSTLSAEMPLHLEDHLAAATIVGSEVPPDLPQPIEWRFDEPQPDWKAAVPLDPSWKPLQAARTEDALRLSLTEATSHVLPWGRQVYGGVYVDLPDWQREDWAYAIVQARTSAENASVGIRFNLRKKTEPSVFEQVPFRYWGDFLGLVNDGSVQTYRLRADWSQGQWEGPWRQLGLAVAASEPASIDLLSVSVIPKEATYASEPAGVRSEHRNSIYRLALYTHAPGRLEYRVRVPEAGRLDVGLGVLRDDAPVTFRITANQGAGEAEIVLEETYGDKEQWAQRTVDLSAWTGRTVSLALEADAEKPGTVALWAAPTLSGAGNADGPNVIFYVIDGGAADHMGVYGYNRRTTPNMDRLAAEGAVFENAYSNSSWTKPSTKSFMTSLQHSVLGGYKARYDPLPDEAVTMAEHMHGAGYQTAVFVANPNAGTLSGLQRGVDVFREEWTEFTYMGGEHYAESSRIMHEAFWRWREAYPAAPYWVHFQTTDVHRPWRSVAPFAGLFVTSELRETFGEWDEQLRALDGPWFARFEETGIDRVTYYDTGRDFYDETMAHQDHQLGQLVERLKARGEWQNTLLIVAADHSMGAAGGEFGRGMQDSVPPEWGAMFRSSVSRIPLIVVWPRRIAGGQRFNQPVSMLDVLPTILDLAGLPRPAVMQGQSLVPLLLGEEGWEPRPVILDEFYVDQETGKFRGRIEVIDGRWGASLEINPEPEQEPEEQRPAPLLLYDLWNDPMCLYSLHQERPDLVEKYTEFLERQWKAHQALAQLFTPSESVALTPEQLRTLRALGYIQ